ncbi:PEP5 (YMR231W) [Zygosaccharomyces parabailii]|nr:PEP5 (YMR231W) [Zygosaccharomyces parabailii]
MAFASWRQFQFFESTPIRDPLQGSDTPLYSDPTLSAATPINKNQFALAVKSNYIRVVSLSESRIDHEFQAYEDNYQITYLEVVDQSFLLAVGEKLGKPSLIKIYKLDNLPNNPSSYHSIVEVKKGNYTYPISVVATSRDLNCICVGFVSGKILLIRGDILRDRGSRQRIIYEDAGKEPITSLQFNLESTVCFAATTTRIMMFSTTGRNRGQPDITLDAQHGISLNCSCFSSYTDEYICYVEGSIDIYTEGGEKRSVVTGLSGVKRISSIDKDHILLVVEAEYARSTVLEVEEFSQSNSNRVIILDLKNQVVTLNNFISSAIIDIFIVTDGNYKLVYLLTSEGTIIKICEKSLEDQLDIAIQKELFDFALELAKQHSLDPLKIQDIHRKYGDWLYKKGSRSEAVEQYIRCLDVVETSEIISKFGINESPDPKGLQNLAHYLWSLIKENRSNSDHITLLLIALVKLKAKNDIQYFIDHYSRSGNFSEDVITSDMDDESFFYSDKNLFDLELVLGLLQESKFEELAYLMACKFAKDPVVIVDLILNTLDDPHAAIRYIRSLSIDETLRVLVTFSKQLLDKCPNDTNILLIAVFTGKFKRTEFANNLKDSEPTHELSDDLMTVFYSYRTFLKYINNVTGGEAEVEARNSIAPTYHPPKASLIFNSFISKPFQFVVFLEACLESYQRYEGSKEDKQVILTTLYDLYLTLANDDIPERQNDWRSRATKVLKESNKLFMASENATAKGSSSAKSVDNSLMMLISHMNRIDIHPIQEGDGETKNISELDKGSRASLLNTFRFMILTDDPQKCMAFMEAHGSQEPYLYCVALKYFISTKQVLEQIGGEKVLKSKILDKILEAALMSVVEIISVLGSTNVATYGLIQEVLINHVRQEQDQISRNKKLINSYESELKSKKKELKDLLDLEKPLHVTIKNKTCYMCHTALELPLVFFKCQHIYHQRCLNEEQKTKEGKKYFKCPKCIVELETSEKLLEAQREISKKTDMLKIALDNGDEIDDRFKIVTDFVGRGGLEYSHVTLE